MDDGFLAFLGLVMIIVLVVGYLGGWGEDERLAREACETTCRPRVAKILNEKCHCLDNTGWLLPAEVAR